jgi:cysteinyl-tRNA synthetase
MINGIVMRLVFACGAILLAACGGCKDAPQPQDVPRPAPADPTAAAASTSATPAPSAPPPETHDDAGPSGPLVSVGPGFPERGPWVSFYGNAHQMKDLDKVARTYRVINIDVDPDANNFTDAQIKVLKAGGKNRVLSYLNLGACEHHRSYWSKAPSGFVPCEQNRAAHLGAYEGYPDEVWMDPSNEAYRKLMVEHAAARLAARGVDGFYLDNLELVEHDPHAKNGPCSAKCRQGGLDLVRALRDKFPDLLLVMQNATSDATRLGTTGGVPYPTLLDGIAHEEVYEPKLDKGAEEELLAWKNMGIKSRSGRPFWIAVEDYVGSCGATARAKAALARAESRGFSGYVSDESGGQKVVCFW